MGIVNNYLNEVRHEFASQALDVKSIAQHPIDQLEKWIEEAVDSQILEPNAMVIGTVSKNGTPSSRVVYLRGLDKEGLKFYTNYESQKGREVEINSSVNALFFYPELERQIRVEGSIKKLTSEESDAYFNARPLESKLGAWASEQSSHLENREQLVERLNHFKEKFGEIVPRPPHWGGYLIKPERFEFWQGRPARLHDRIIYKQSKGKWDTFRIAP